jgi:ornithine cyclodeaminase/alanine dehydrogenase
VVQPGYMGIHLPAPRGEIDFKAGYHKAAEMISLKASSGGFIDNPAAHGVPNGMGTILLFDARSCALACVMDGSLITGLRTGAAGAVSVKALARRNAKAITSIGTGNQARMQVRAIREVMKIERIHAWDSNPETLARYKADIEGELGIPVAAANSKREAVEQADILVTTTRGKGSLVEAGWVKPGTHIVAIGTDQRGKQELDPEIFRNAKIVTDSTEQCVEKGETWHPLDRKIIARDDIHAEIGEILLGRKPGRESDDEITIFDSTGMAIQDNTTSAKIYRNALERRVGTFFEFL